MPRRLPAALLALCVSAVAIPTRADDAKPDARPDARPDAGGDMLRSTAPDKLRALSPIPGKTPIDRTTVNPVTPGMRPLTLRREGSYVVDRGGHVVASADGKTYQFEFDAPDPQAQVLADVPMVLLPNVALMTVQNTLHAAPGQTHFAVTGVVTEYLGRNYLLVQKATLTPEPATRPASPAAPAVGVPVGPQYTPVPAIGAASPPAPPVPQAPPTSAAPTTAPAATAPSTQPMSAADVLDDMLRPGSAEKLRPLTAVRPDPVTDRSTAAAGTAPGQASARPMLLRREGSYVIDRTGRLTRTPDGRGFEFNFEADAQTLQDPPMVLLPNTTLMMVQDARRNSGRDARFRVSGVVTEYGGRNYLLLQKAVLVSDNAGLAGG